MRSDPLLYLLLLLLVFPIISAANSLEDKKALVTVNNILNPHAFQAKVRMSSYDRSGKLRKYSFTIRKSGTQNTRVFFLAPPREKNREVLRQGDNMWTYLPNIKRILRVGSRDSFMGGDFNNSDLLRLDLPSDYKVISRKTTSRGILLTLQATGKEVSYQKMDLLTDNSYMPLEEKMYSRSGILIKVMTLSKVRNYTGHRRPSQFSMTNHIRRQKTVMNFEEFKVVKSFPRSVFTRESLGDID